MTKKGYQKRLPTVLPPAAPAPRASTENLEVVQDEQDEQDEHQQATPARPARNSVLVPAGIALVAVLVAATVNLLLLLSDGAPDDRRTGPAPEAAEGLGVAPLPEDESYVETLVQPDGEIVVQQWIRAEEPLRRLSLALPAVPGGEELSAEGIEVVADGAVVVGPDQITSRAATYVFPETTGVQVSYRLTNAIQRSNSAVGRALAVATSLDVTYEPRPDSETRVVNGPEVLSLACSPSSEVLFVPCGEAIADDQWRVELTGRRVTDRVVAALDLS